MLTNGMKQHLPIILSILTNIGLGIIGTTIGYLTVPELPESVDGPPEFSFGYPVVVLITWCFCTIILTPIRGPYRFFHRFGTPYPPNPTELIPPTLHRPQPNHSRAITLLILAIFVVIMLGVLMLEAAHY